jgi:hypothetical protein
MESRVSNYKNNNKETGDVFEINYRRGGTYGPTDTKIGTFKENEVGDIEIDIFSVPMSGQMIVRRRPPTGPQNG